MTQGPVFASFVEGVPELFYPLSLRVAMWPLLGTGGIAAQRRWSYVVEMKVRLPLDFPGPTGAFGAVKASVMVGSWSGLLGPTTLQDARDGPERWGTDSSRWSCGPAPLQLLKLDFTHWVYPDEFGAVRRQHWGLHALTGADQ